VGGALSLATPFEERLVDAVGPIVVKEVRQGLRARIFGIAFGLLLVGCLVTAIAAMAEARYGFDDDLGQRYFALFMGGLGVLEFFVIPFTAFRSTVREREDETWVLLALTGLGGRRIVRGKVVSALSQGMLYASACAPFVLFSYYLNGVALPTLVAALLLAAAWTVFLVSLGVALGTQAHSRKGRAASHLFAIAALGGLAFMGVIFAAVLADEGERMMRDDAFLAFLLGMVGFTLSTAWLLVEGAAASLALPSEAASRGPRVVLTVQILASCAAGAAGLLYANASKEGAAILSVVVSLMLVFSGVFAISERDGAPRAHQSPGWLKPGAVRSFWLVAVLLLVSTAVWASVFPSLKGSDYGARRLHVLLAGPAYVLLYLSLASILGRTTPLNRFGEPVATRAAMAGLVGVGSIFSPIVALVLGGRADDKEWNLFNPMLGMVNFADRIHEVEGREMLLVLWAFTAMAFIAATAVLKSRDGVRQT
jgi:hypothetical protein